MHGSKHKEDPFSDKASVSRHLLIIISMAALVSHGRKSLIKLCLSIASSAMESKSVKNVLVVLSL